MGAANFGWLKLAKNIYSFWLWDDSESYDDVIALVEEDLETLWAALDDTLHRDERDVAFYYIESYDTKNADQRYIRLRMFVECWYHEGARFDIEIDEEYNATKTMHKQAQVFVNKVNKIYKKYTTPLKVVARFSSGETMYAIA